MNLDNIFHELYDPLRQNATYTLAGKVDEMPFTEVIAKEYDPITNTTKVLPIASGGGDLLEVRNQVHYAGDMPGTGEIFAIVPEERYKVAFVDGYRTGMYSCGEITGTTYSYTSKHPPAYAPFQQQGVGRLVVDPRRPAGWFKGRQDPDQRPMLGNASYTNNNSEVYTTYIGSRDVDDQSHQHIERNGTNMSYAEEMMREAVLGLKNAMALLEQG
jgi:hypothetical protein